MNRAGVFEDFDVTGFTPVKPIDAPPVEAIREVSEASSFRSREAEAKPKKRPPRIYRTGRNVQLNVKVRAETLDRFYNLADSQGWVLGETLERALDALQRDLSRPGA